MKTNFTHILDAPEQGMALIYFQTSLYCGKYKREAESIDLGKENVEERILEIHLFDESTEYRAVYSQEKEEYIEAVIRDDNQICDEIIKEESYLLDEYRKDFGNEKMGTANYMTYDEDDMLKLINYRLYIPEKGEATIDER